MFDQGSTLKNELPRKPVASQYWRRLSVGVAVTALTGSLILATHSPAIADDDVAADMSIVETPVLETPVTTPRLTEAPEPEESAEVQQTETFPTENVENEGVENETSTETSTEAVIPVEEQGRASPWEEFRAALETYGAGSIEPFAIDNSELTPEELFNENFENVSGTSYPTSLNSYTGASGQGYTASGYWLDAGYCNGFVTSHNTDLPQGEIDSTYCGRNPGYYPGDYWAVRAKAWALGNLPGSGKSDPRDNHALSTNTSGGRPSTDINSPHSIMFQTAQPVHLNKPGRFIAFSVDAANTYCENPTPQMLFQYTQNSTTTSLPLNDGRYIDPCVGGQLFDARSTFGTPGNQGGAWNSHSNWIAQGRYGTFYSGSFLLDESDSIGLILRNVSHASSEGAGIGNSPGNSVGYVSGSANGNDGAIDNIRILDVTPVMEKSFDPKIQSVGRTSQMTLTIHNRTDLARKEGWQFTDVLPEGLKFANKDVDSTCDAGITVDQDNGELIVTDGVLERGKASCTITTTVTSTEPAEFINGRENRNFKDVKGIDGPTNAEVEFYSGSVSWEKVDENDSDSRLEGSVWQLEGPTPETVSTLEDGWPVGEVLDCVADTAEDCTGLDRDPAGGKFLIEGLPSGEYKLTELEAPEGYIVEDGPWTAEITEAKRNVQFSAQRDGKITNGRGEAVWAKVDQDTEALLEGSEWELIRTSDGTMNEVLETIPVVDCVADQPDDCGELRDRDSRPGQFQVEDLPTGWYHLKETKAPQGYKLRTEIQGPVEVKKGNTRIDFKNIDNELLDPATITIEKIVQDVNGENGQPGEGWTVGAALAGEPAEGTDISPEGTQVTGADGKASEVWEVTFPAVDSTADVRLWEKEDSHAGYEFAEAQCEIVPAEGESTTLTIRALDQGGFTLAGDNAAKPGDEVSCTFENKPKPGEVVWQKVDESDPAELLSGSEWTITGPGFTEQDNVIEDCTSGDCAGLLDQDPEPGKFLLKDLAWGDYEIIETKAPAGYELTGTNYEFSIGPEDPAELLWDLGAIENTRRDGPVLPLTGGIGRDFFSILGVVTLLLGAIAAGVVRSRNRGENDA